MDTRESGSQTYTEHDLESILDAAAEVVMAAVAADPSGPFAYFAEMTAAGTFLYDARDRYRNNRLVQEIFRRHEEGSFTLESEEVTTETLLADIGRVDGILRRDEEGLEFRRFLLELAEKVTSASRKRWFGPRVSEEEARFLAELRSRLGLPGD